MEKASKCKEPSAKTNWLPLKCAEPQLNRNRMPVYRTEQRDQFLR